jgi:hypothetical protein
MPKDKYFERIDGVFENIGLGNNTAERIVELQIEYDRVMNQADRIRGNKKRKGLKFQDVLESVKDEPKKKDS